MKAQEVGPGRGGLGDEDPVTRQVAATVLEQMDSAARTAGVDR